MSLLQHEDFAIYRIRSRYLQCVRDGVGDRLITFNQTALNLPGFRNAGWGHHSEIKRTHSPPIGTSTDISFVRERAQQTPVIEETPTPQAQDETNNQNGSAEPEFLPGRVPTGDSLGVPLQRPPTREEDMSSDSDDSDDQEEAANTAGAMQIKFTKMPVRTRSGSSPIRSVRTGPQITVNSPKTIEGNRVRAGSHGTLELTRRAVQQERRERRGRERSESNESDAPFQFEKKPRSSLSSWDVVPLDDGMEVDDEGDLSDDSMGLSSEFTETVDSNPSLMRNAFARPQRTLAPLFPSVHNDLPPARPISQIQPVSALTQLLKAQKPGNPMYDYSIFSGQGELRPLKCNIYCPNSKEPSEPLKILLRRDEKGTQGIRETSVADAIGYSLYLYIEEKREPPLTDEQCDVNKWTFRMADDDGEVDYDFPPLDRTKPLITFLAKDRRGAQKGPGEFGLVPATEEEYKEAQRLAPTTKPLSATPEPALAAPPAAAAPPIPGATGAAVSGLSAIPAVSIVPPSTILPPKSDKLDAPGKTSLEIPASQPSVSTITTKLGPTRILRIFVNTVDETAKSVAISVTTDYTMQDVLELVCKKKHLNMAEFNLKIYGTAHILPTDRLVNTIPEDKDLELIRKSLKEMKNSVVDSERPLYNTFHMAQAPTNSTAPVAKKKTMLHPSSGTPDMVYSANYQKFVVFRRQPMSFINRHERVLAIDGEYIHVMPSDQKTIFESPKTITLHISSVIGCKVSRKSPSNFRIAVLKPEPREKKSYDFEAANPAQAAEIVQALTKKVDSYRLDHPIEIRGR